MCDNLISPIHWLNFKNKNISGCNLLKQPQITYRNSIGPHSLYNLHSTTTAHVLSFKSWNSKTNCATIHDRSPRIPPNTQSLTSAARCKTLKAGKAHKLRIYTNLSITQWNKQHKQSTEQKKKKITHTHTHARHEGTSTSRTWSALLTETWAVPTRYTWAPFLGLRR